MEDWRKRWALFLALFAPGTLWLTVFFTAPLLLVALYSLGERGDYGDTSWPSASTTICARSIG